MADVLLVEPDHSVRAPLHRLIPAALCVTESAVVEEVTRTRADAVLVRWRHASYDGVDVLARLQRAGASSAVVLYDYEEHPDAETARVLALGATDVVFQPLRRPNEFLARVNAAARRAGPRGILRVGTLELDLDTREVRVSGEPVPITRGEFRLLLYLGRRAGSCIERDELYAAVFETRFRGRASNALATAVSRLRPKLGNAARQLVAVPGIGYRLDP